MLTPDIQLDGLRRFYHQYTVRSYAQAEGRIPAIFDNMSPLGSMYHKLEWIQQKQQKLVSRERRDLKRILEHMCVLTWAGNDIGGSVELMGRKHVVRFKNARRSILGRSDPVVSTVMDHVTCHPVINDML